MINIFSKDFKIMQLDFTVYVECESDEECRDQCIPLKEVSEQILEDYGDIIMNTYNYITVFDTSEIKDDIRKEETEITSCLMLPSNRYGIEKISSSIKVSFRRIG